MKYLTLILDIVAGLQTVFEFVSKLIAQRKRIEEVKDVEDLVKETKKDVSNGDIQKINEKLKF